MFSHCLLCFHGGAQVRYFPDGPIKKDYVVVPEPLAKDASALTPWIEESIGFARNRPKSGTGSTA